MRFSKLLVFAFLILLPLTLLARENRKVTYLANEGFLIQAGGKKILIDALFGKGIPGYPVVPDGLRQELEAGLGPFGDVDVVLASHFHADHFSPDAVGEYLANHTSVRFYSTRDAEKKLQESFAKYSEIRYRVIGVSPDVGGRNTFEYNGIRLTALNLHHGEGTSVENLGWLLEIDGFRLLHVGDTEVNTEDVRPYHLADEMVDIAFVPSWFFVYERLKPVLSEIAAKNIIVMHLAEPDAPPGYFGDAGSFAGLLRMIRDVAPNAWIPLKSLESHEYN